MDPKEQIITELKKRLEVLNARVNLALVKGHIVIEDFRRIEKHVDELEWRVAALRRTRI